MYAYPLFSYILSDIEWIDFNPKRRRIRCIGHIINLSLQSFLTVMPRVVWQPTNSNLPTLSDSISIKGYKFMNFYYRIIIECFFLVIKRRRYD
jgi:hypothetical protein